MIHISAAGRFKLTKRLALTTEYFYILPDQIDAKYHNLSVGVDIETGGHVFQLQFTNSTGMFERSFITETEGQWGKGDIRYGFNISRVFTVAKPKKPKECVQAAGAAFTPSALQSRRWMVPTMVPTSVTGTAITPSVSICWNRAKADPSVAAPGMR